MSVYTVTISADDERKATATIVVRLDSSGLLIQEIAVRPGSDGQPIPPELANLEFAQVMETVVELSHGRLPRPPVDTQGPPGPPDEPPAKMPRATTGKSTTSGKSATSGKSRQQGPESTNDVPSDLPVMFWRLGTAAKVADHYSVPRHVATGWVRLLRQAGTVPSPWPQQARSSGRRGRRRQQ